MAIWKNRARGQRASVLSGRLLKMIAKSLPDQRATFEDLARDLKTEAERGA